ncbi:MAG: hypothetical protein HC887_05140 [Desulfobacteraceae bacterium]|nr:hypothetical protein [Desulfobacteraceae bacterium]
MYRRIEEAAILWEKEKAALWRAPDLDIALKWKREHDPKKTWALRYGENFDLAMKFLNASKTQRVLNFCQ